MDKELISSILQMPAIKSTFNKYVRKYSFLYSDLAADLQKALIEAIYRYETDSAIWDMLTINDLLGAEKTEFTRFKRGLISYLCKTIKYKSYKIANKHHRKTCLDTELHEEIEQNARKKKKSCSLYFVYFKQHYEQLTAKQKEFCKQYVHAEKFSSYKKTRMLQRIRKKMGVAKMGDLKKKDRVQAQLKMLEESLENIEIEGLNRMLELDTVYANYSLYEHMKIENRRELILGFRNNTAVSDRALIDFVSGLYAWREKAFSYLQEKCELKMEEIE